MTENCVSSASSFFTNETHDAFIGEPDLGVVERVDGGILKAQTHRLKS